MHAYGPCVRPMTEALTEDAMKESNASGEMIELDGLFGLSQIDGVVEDAIDLAKIAGGVAGGSIAARFIRNKAPWIKDQSPYVKGGLLVLAGLGAGIGVARLGDSMQIPAARAVGAGLGAGMIVDGLLTIANAAAPATMSQLNGYLGDDLGAPEIQEYQEQLNGYYLGEGSDAGFDDEEEAVPLSALQVRNSEESFLYS